MAAPLQGSLDQTVSLPIANGQGHETTPKKTTGWVTITGTATITFPNNGTWSLTAKDTVAG